MLRGWQYLCRPTRWRLWEGCRAGRKRKNSVRRGQGFLYGGPVRNNAHARRYFSAAKGFGGSDEKKGIRVRSSHQVHSLRWKKKKKVMLRGWQYLCRPTRWRLWEGCRAGRERKNSVRRGQGFLYGRPVRNNAHARRPERRHLLEANESQTLTPGRQTKLHRLRWKKKKSDASRLAVPLQTHQMATVGRMPSRTREEKLRQEGLGLPLWRTRPEQYACEEVLLCCKGFLGLGYKKKKSALVAATGCIACGGKKKKSDASRLAVPLQTHQMATVGRMPSRTREEKLRQEGLGLPVWRTRPEQCACEEVLLCCKGFMGLGYKKKKSALVAATECM
ncbi:uncharacterized protein LOC133497241 isoform X2 [Syngnathoides biaculeatus]|uniref:uncharacterized protein LOC133497241 isoform X2 n=1 Tax=Syngnathoides biaculeatus TaxID=300417 RepID=UPI002ADDB388|nr:uncharacterized protein LOC133497241 isoform X2 [Syngnathoides biaculeatus]